MRLEEHAGRWHRWDLDGKMLLFDRVTGTNILIENEETTRLKQRAPRSVQVSVTNDCNKSCSFCYRPRDVPSIWTFDGVLDLARFCGEWGVVELAFGGGEPTLFPGFSELLRRIWHETPICSSFTTNGSLLTPDLLEEIKGCYGQIQLSIAEEDDKGEAVELLVRSGARFGVNYFVTPERVRTIEPDLLALAQRGVRDILLLSYKGFDLSFHLDDDDCRRFDESVERLHRLLGERVSFKVDVCWGRRLQRTPQLLYEDDCTAGGNFLSISSDKRVMGCSFADIDDGIPFDDPRELAAAYKVLKKRKSPARRIGCSRLPDYGVRTQTTARS